MKVKKENWNLSELYHSENEWDEKYNYLETRITNLKSNINFMNINELIKKYEKILEIRDKLKGYMKLKYDEDNKRGLDIFFNRIQDIDMEISKLTVIINNKIIHSKNEIDVSYSRYSDELLENQEITINSELFLEINKEIFSSQKNFQKLLSNIQFDKINDFNNVSHILTLDSYSKYMRSKDRILRKNAFLSIEKSLKDNSILLSQYLYNYINNNIKLSKILGYKKCINRSLNLEEIDSIVYNTCINYINNNKEIFERYLFIKQKNVGVDKMHIFDLYAPMFQEKNDIITYENAKKIIKEALSVLGKEYIKIVEKIFDEKWVDVYERKNKTNSAYSYNIYANHPYILVNFQYTLNDVFILAHEIGHAVHYYLANNNQSYINAQVTSLTTEIAAMTNECLVYKYLLNNNEFNNKEIVGLYLDKFMTILCKQSILNKFETTLYDEIEVGNKLDLSKLSKVYVKTIKYYYGDSIVIDGDIYEWAKILHFYKNFQVYKYLIAFCTATNISDNINYISEDYLYMLKLGRKMNIKKLLKLVKINLEKDNLYKETFNSFKELMDEI